VNAPPQNPNAHLLLTAVRKLVPLLEQIAFVGGCATGLLVTDPGAAPVRPTLDVDAIVEIASYAELAVLEDHLLRLGFQPLRAEGAPVCRWIHEDVVLDLMPTESSILGFSNRWYRPALESADRMNIGDHQVRIITAPYFLATKLEAFRDRGKNDYRMSHDLEDIVTVLDGRPEIVVDVQRAPHELQQYLAHEFSALTADRDFMEALPGHLLPDIASQERIYIVLDRIQRIAVQG
jgi:predicted nucleotidyltransferase